MSELQKLEAEAIRADIITSQILEEYRITLSSDWEGLWLNIAGYPTHSADILGYRKEESQTKSPR
jgi:hypothetical protein